MRRIMVFSIVVCATVSLKALDIDQSPIQLITNACALDEEAYINLDTQEKRVYVDAIAHALYSGQKTKEEIIASARNPLRYDVARSYYLHYGQTIDLDTPKISFSVRILMQHNRLDRTVTPDGTLDLSSLYIADLDGIEEIPNINDVRYLNLSHNAISLLHPSNFRMLEHLATLDLSFNKLATLRPKSFKHLAHLRELHLDHNYITNLDINTFTGLTKLQELTITYNLVEWIAIDAFHDLHNLKTLDISNNQLNLISPRVFNPLKHLKQLSMRQNHFKLIHSHVLYPLKNLESLDLSSNHITRITQDTLYGLKKLQILNLSDNDLMVLDISNPHILPNLGTIIVSGNPIKEKNIKALRNRLSNVEIMTCDAFDSTSSQNTDR